MDKLYVVGVLDNGPESLTPRAREIVRNAELLLGGQRLLSMFPDFGSERGVICLNLDQFVDVIRANLGKKRIVVLASGDPNFYGISRHLLRFLPKAEVQIIPNVSSMQLAFAKIKESWDDAVFASAHGRCIEDVVEVVRTNHKLGIFTDNVNTPAAIARALLSHGINGFHAFVCENLGGPQERVSEGSLAQLAEMSFSPVNVLVLIRDNPSEEAAGSTEWTIGIPDEEFLQRKARRGLITKAEIRVVSLSKLCIRETSTVWDIGAGSGSIGIEAALMAKRGKVFAIEKNPGDVEIVQRNMAKFHVRNMLIVRGFAPEGLERFDDPDAVFIGGTGGRMKPILETAAHRIQPGGRIVANTISLESLQVAFTTLRQLGFNPAVTMVNVAHTKRLVGLTALTALDPVLIVSGSRPDTEEAIH
ncbi:MAG: precorrin-6y C5,15-methyltransferase (decarboxylating) subunit CbiE [Chloroflexota bacterium]|nr:MAG: precorrin-6y C5,15-methyltransferase (decarboxylating) subunit CbiE [Chloroflexota bacterium]